MTKLIAEYAVMVVNEETTIEEAIIKANTDTITMVTYINATNELIKFGECTNDLLSEETIQIIDEAIDNSL